ncbi:MAG: isoprenylcysteine carboxylmethyltransferase family protein [Burkholderiales bacterium]|nr:isoprenylcysteine carboxylmethyltransferase family protein [Opitutaceae bacterium]
MLGRIWCALYIAGRKNAELCQDGPYSLVRNPLYVFSFVGALGVALATQRPLLVPIVAALFVAYYHIVIRAEETRLAALFPAAYPAYRREVPRALPRLTGYRSRERLTLDPADVARAMREVVWFAAAFAAAVALGRFV